MTDRATAYVINLDRSVERWERLQSAFADAPIDLNRISAVDGRNLNLTPDDLNVMLRHHGRPFQPGEIGCYLSHLEALKAFLKSARKIAIILEDDAVPTELIDCLPQVIEAFDTQSQRKPSFLNMVKHPKVYFTPVADIQSKTELVRAYRFPINAAAIVWDRASAENFLANYSSPLRSYDCALRDFNSVHGGGFALTKSLVVQSGKTPSDIEAFGDRSKFPILHGWRIQAWRARHRILAARQMRKEKRATSKN